MADYVLTDEDEYDPFDIFGAYQTERFIRNWARASEIERYHNDEDHLGPVMRCNDAVCRNYSGEF